MKPELFICERKSNPMEQDYYEPVRPYSEVDCQVLENKLFAVRMYLQHAEDVLRYFAEGGVDVSLAERAIEKIQTYKGSKP